MHGETSQRKEDGNAHLSRREGNKLVFVLRSIITSLTSEAEGSLNAIRDGMRTITTENES